MKWSGKWSITLVLTIISSSLYSQTISNPKKEQQTSIIPKVQQISIDSGFFILNRGASVLIEDATNNNQLDLEKKSISSFLTKEFSINFRYSSAGKHIILDILPSKTLNEEYYFKILNDTIKITGSSPMAVNHGLTTLKQLILLNKYERYAFIPEVTIYDRPRFQHRGLLLDCSRHFFKKETIKKYIDLLSFYKTNVLHWHLTEDQGWRIFSDTYPKLNTIASTRTELDGSEYGGIYTKDDIREIVRYASDRYIEVIPEIELPGHSQAAIAAYPHLSCTGEQIEVANDWGVFKEIYCAGNDSVFTFLEDILSEVIDLFPSKYIHIGGDEAPKVRWENCSKCQNRMTEHGLKNEHALQSYFIKRIQKFLKTKDRDIIGWDEILEGGLAEGAVVQSWRGFDGGIEAAKHGNQVIMSPTSHAYLDYNLKAIDLEKIYNFHPIPADLDSKYHNLIIGGECNMWTEHVLDDKMLDQKVFPRMLGMSEALWTAGEKNYEEFNERIQAHYPILDSLGVNYGEEVLPFTYDVNHRNDSMFLVITSSNEELIILYHSSKQEVGVNAIYKQPIYIDSTENFWVQAFKNEEAFGKAYSIPVLVHKALNKKVTYKNKYSQWYTAGGNGGLVDGKVSYNIDFKDGCWQGFWGEDLEVIIDLEEVDSITNIGVQFYQYSNSWIFLPKKVIVEVSIDGINWDTEAFKNDFPFKNREKVRGKFAESYIIFSEKPIKCRYIKVKAINIGKVPDWHEAAGSDAWLFIDEIEVK